MEDLGAVVVVDLAIAETVVVGFREEEEVAVEDFLTEETTGFRVGEVETSAVVAVGKVMRCVLVFLISQPRPEFGSIGNFVER